MFGFETVELCERVGDLGGSVDGGKNHVAMFEDVVNERLDRGVEGAWEKGGPVAELDAVFDCGGHGEREVCS